MHHESTDTQSARHDVHGATTILHTAHETAPAPHSVHGAVPTSHHDARGERMPHFGAHSPVYSQRQSRERRDQGVLMIAVYHYVIGVIFLLGTLILAMPTALLAFIGLTQAAPALLGMFAVGLVTAVVMAFSLLFLATGYGLWNGRQWARVAAITLAILTLLIFPMGTIAGGLILWHLFKSDVASMFD